MSSNVLELHEFVVRDKLQIFLNVKLNIFSIYRNEKKNYSEITVPQSTDTQSLARSTLYCELFTLDMMVQVR